MSFNIPYKVRATIYVANLLGAPLIGYLLARGIIGELEVQLWTAEVAAAFALAGLNVSKNQ